jgi:hypothetical protein
MIHGQKRLNLSGENTSFIETHLADCPPCSKRVMFARKFTALAKEQFTRANMPDEPCPDTSDIVALEADGLDEETAQHVRAHLLFCKLCREEYLLLRRLSNEQLEEKALAGKQGGITIDVIPGGIRCREIFGSGHLVNPIAVAVLGESEAPSRSIRVEDTIEDAGSGASSIIRILVDVDPERARAMMHVEANPPRSDWTASLVGPDGNELSSSPLVADKTILGSDLPFESYAVNILKGDISLGSFAVEIRSD